MTDFATRRRSTRPRTLPRAVLLLAGVALSGCAGLENSQQDGIPRTLGPWHRISPEQVVVGLAAPTAPAVLGARQRSTPGEETIQEAVLGNRTTAVGENRLTVAVDWTGSIRPSTAAAETGGDYRFAPETVARNAATLLKGATVSPEQHLRQNALGPYRYLTAEYAGEASCVYAWQVLRRGTKALPGGATAVALQLRYCGPAATDPDRLVELLDAVALKL
jgi:hypothetical protein